MIKKLSVLFFVLGGLLFSGCGPTDEIRVEPDFYMNISLSEQDVSLGAAPTPASVSTTGVVITGRNVTYSYLAAGATEVQQETFQLNWTDYDDMVQMITATQLNQNGDELNLEKMETGIFLALRCEVKLEGDAESTVATVVGMEDTIQNRLYVQDVLAVIEFLKAYEK